MSDIDISIVIPTYNREKFLQEAIESIIPQRKVSLELIVIDDASTDGTERVIKEMSQRLPSNICIVYKKNHTKQFAHISRFKGLYIARGSVVAFMDDDDFYINSSIFELVKEVFETNKDIGAFIASTIPYSNGCFLNKVDLNIEGLVKKEKYLQYFDYNYPKPQSTLSSFFNTDLLKKSGIDKFKMVNDTCIYLNGILSGDVYIFNEAVAAYRIHDSNISKKAFPISFIIQTLEEKRRIYKKVEAEHLLIDSAEWYFRNLKKSVYYFIYSSNYNLKIMFYQFMWLIFRGRGARLLFLKDFFKRVV